MTAAGLNQLVSVPCSKVTFCHLNDLVIVVCASTSGIGPEGSKGLPAWRPGQGSPPLHCQLCRVRVQARVHVSFFAEAACLSAPCGVLARSGRPGPHA